MVDFAVYNSKNDNYSLHRCELYTELSAPIRGHDVSQFRSLAELKNCQATFNSTLISQCPSEYKSVFQSVYPNHTDDMIWIIITDNCDAVGIIGLRQKLIFSGKSLICIPRSAFVSRSTTYGRTIIESAKKYHIVRVTGLRILPEYTPVVPFTEIP